MKKILLILTLAIGQIVVAQTVNSYGSLSPTISAESVFLDASAYSDVGDNLARGLVFPRTSLTAFTFVNEGSSFGNFPTGYDGMVVYNTATSGVAGAGLTDGTLSKGFWYYDNPTPAGGAPTTALVNAGTWRRLGGESSTVKSKTVIATVAAGATSASLDVNGVAANKIAPGTVGTFLGAKIYNSSNKLVMTADSDYDSATNIFATGNGYMYQVLPEGTYTVIVEYK